MKITLDIYRKDVGMVRGRTLREKQEILPRIMKLYLPKSLLDKYKIVRLFADTLYVNRIPFLVTISKHVKLQLSAYLENCLGTSILEKLNAAIKYIQIKIL